MAAINIRGVLVDLLIKIDPEVYGLFVTTDKKGENGIIVQYINTMYRTMVASLLYYNKFVNALKRTGYQLNQYDTFVENRMVNDKQHNIWFHVDDCKLIHQDSKVNDEFINTLPDEHESVDME